MNVRGHGALRVVTINTGKCDGPYRARLDALLESLAQLDADVILAQEAFEAVDRTRGDALSTPRHLATGLGMALAFHPIRQKPRAVEGVTEDSWSGLATLSRWPLRDVTWRALPDDPDDGDRAVLFASIESPRGLVRTANTHLTHLRHRDDLRLTQMRDILADRWWHGEAAARLVAGDFNARPEHSLHELLREGVDDWRAVDAYGLAGDPAQAATIRRETPAGTTEARLDYVYLLGLPHRETEVSDTGLTGAAVEAARVVLDQPVHGTMPSDHFGVMVDLALSKNEAS